MPLSTQDNAKLFQQLKLGFKRTINWNIYQSKRCLLKQNKYLNNFIDPSFQSVNRIFILSFKHDAQRINNKIYFLPNVEIKHFHIIIDVIISQPVKNN